MRLPVALTIIAAALLAAGRGLPFILWPHSAFDADQAIVGLMAKHLAELRALPLFYYGQPYMLGVQAWLAAPLFALFGVSITLLKLPLLVINGAAAAVLVWLLIRETRLRPLHAFAAAALFIVATPVVGAQLVAAMGGSVEPFLYVLLIWVLRDRPVACGLVAGVGFLHREFTVYGLAAVLIVEAVYARGDWRRVTLKSMLIAVAFVLCIQLIGVLRPFNDMFGPELPRLQSPEEASTFYAITTRLACASPAEVAGNIRWLFRENLPTLLGSTARMHNLYYAGEATSARPWLLAVFVVGVIAAVLRAAFLCFARRQLPPAFAVYLLLIAVQSCVFYVGSCDVQGPMVVRYTLLALLGPIAIAAAYLSVEPNAHAKRATTGLLLGLMAANTYSYVALSREYRLSPPRAPQAAVAQWLEDHDFRYARADYWDGYYITFITNERVIVSATPHRILVYESQVSRASKVMYVQRAPCPSAEMVSRYWLCLEDRSTPASAIDDTPRYPSEIEVLRFRDELERTYRDALGRAPGDELVDVRGTTLATREYLRQRLSGCAPGQAETRVRDRLDGRAVQPPCGSLAAGEVPRDELLQFRDRIAAVPAGIAHTAAPTSVDREGEVVWTQAYIVSRMAGCDHGGATARVVQMITGSATVRSC